MFVTVNFQTFDNRTKLKMLRLVLLSIALLSPCSGMVRVKVHKLEEDMNQMVDEGIMNFGINLNKLLVQHAQQGENVVFSPMGIYMMLALAHLGANGQTRNEIGEVMGLPKSSEQALKVHENLGAMMKHMQSGGNANVTIANGMFLQNGYELKNSFKQQLQSYYNNHMVDMDFNSGEATDMVNRWFAANTRGKIVEFYEESIPNDTKLLLANALCFNGNWNNNFPAESTKQETFETEDGQRQPINMMHKTDTVPYYYNQRYQYEAIGIPYKQNEYQMYLVLPGQGQNLKNLMEVFNYQHIQQIIASSKPTTVDIKMPQMKIKTSNKIKDMLMQLGVNQLFESPDLSNMVDGSNLKVSQVSYALEMNVNEQGTDVCAGSTEEYKIRRQQTDEATKQFYVHKPYLFFIYHPSTKAIMFYGNVYQACESIA